MGIAAVLVKSSYNTETKTYDPLSTYHIEKKAEEMLGVQLRTPEIKEIYWNLKKKNG